MKSVYKIIILFIVLMSNFAFAADLNDNQAKRYNSLSNEIRCVVCQSEPVATSSAKIAQDMREIIKQRILLGENDRQIRKYFADHYGEYVLLRPSFNTATILLWLTPFILIIFGGLIIYNRFKYNDAPINDDDIDALNILKDLENRK